MKPKRSYSRWLILMLLGFSGTFAKAQSGTFDGLQIEYTITSVGAVKGSTRTVSLDSAHRVSWAQYALWSNENRDIYFKDNEVFEGAVHANTPLYFSGDPIFNGLVTSATNWFGGSISDVVFNKGFTMGVPTESLASVDFVDMKNKAELVLTGETAVRLDGTNMFVYNSRKGWNYERVPVPESGLVYIDRDASSSGADLWIWGQLDGRVTFVTERDIKIWNDLTYATDPKIDPSSDDALGLISNRDIVVQPNAGDNVEIYAHLLATGNLTPDASTDGSFGVANYNYGSPRGALTVHGGIAQDYRGAVGTFSMASGQTVTGFEKNYTYDTRFRKNPPPHYPPLEDELDPGIWRDK